MRIVFLSPDEPFYLPAFYQYLCERLPEGHEIKAVLVPPVYKNTSRGGLVVRYMKTFGLREAAALSYKVLSHKAKDALWRERGPAFFSLPSVFKKYEVPYVYEQEANGRQNLERLRKWETDLVVSVSCPQIFTKGLIELPPMGCLNLHGSLLPDYRGVMPSFWVLANDEREAGITLFFVNERIDAGDVLLQRRYPIYPDDTLDGLIRRSKRIGAEMVIEGIGMIASGGYETWPLDMTRGRYFKWPARGDVKRFLSHGRRFR
jgi:methionyl-tRNA formyltransferase